MAVRKPDVHAVFFSSAQTVLMKVSVYATEEKDDDDEEEEAELPWQDALLDVELALLSRPAEALPSAPLRDAVEALFRVTCHVLTGTGASSGLETPSDGLASTSSSFLRLLPRRRTPQLEASCRSSGLGRLWSLLCFTSCVSNTSGGAATGLQVLMRVLTRGVGLRL